MARFAYFALVGTLVLTATAGARAGDAAPPDPDRRRLRSIEVDVGGESGVIRTEAEYLGEAPAEFHFGAPHCKGRPIGATTLEQLHVALRTRQLVTVAAIPAAAGSTPRCLSRVTFWPPEP